MARTETLQTAPAMKLVHISDIHVNEEPILGHEPNGHLQTCLDHVLAHHGDADRIVVTGDLTHHGRASSYERLRDILDACAFPETLEPRLLLGNHDDRDNFRTAFPDAATDPNGFVQWEEDTPAGRFVYLDTLEPGTHAGSLSGGRLEWLAERLDAAPGDVFVFMHHNPAPVGVANADAIGLMDAAPFHDLVRRHRDRIRHIFFGHCHFTLSGSLHGVPFSAPRSTNHPCWPDIGGDGRRMGFGPFERTYSVVLIEPDHVTVHSIDFMRQDDVLWHVTDETGWINESADGSVDGATTSARRQ